MKHLRTIIPALGALLFLHCNGDDTIVTNPSLTDPSVMPKVIYTYPADKGIGPFSVYNRYESSRYHFLLQFNKLIDVNSLYGRVKIDGFDVATSIGISTSSTGDFADIIYCRVYANGGAYHNEYRMGKTYTVTLKEGIIDLHGNEIPSTSFSFIPEPEFRVVRTGPNGEVAPEYMVEPTLLFNSPVDASIVSSLSVAPSLQGTWHISTDSVSAYFSVTGGLISGAEYTVSLASTAKDHAGHRIIRPTTFSFLRVSTFKVSSCYTSSSYSTYEQSLDLYFTLPLDTSTVRNNIIITPSLAGRFEISTSSVRFIPDSGFTPAASYFVSVTSSVRSVNGDALAPFEATVIGPSFQIEMTTPYWSSPISRYSTLSFRVNSLLDTASVRAAFSITPAVSGELIAQDRTIDFDPNGPLQANTTYTVKFSTAMKTSRGWSLPNSRTFYFTTGP